MGENHINWKATRSKNARGTLRKQVEVLRSGTQMALAPLPLHKSVYTSEERFEAERTHIFLGQPLVAGLSGDIPNDGDVLLFDAVGTSILVTRGKDGKARAFLNMCTHRGASLIDESEPWTGHAKKLTCPFHAWTFETGEGKLIGQPGSDGFKNCEIGGRNLIELPCAEYIGLIFVRADPDGEPIDAKAHLGSFKPELEQLELHRAEPVKKGILTADSNWKFALDTYGESYHFGALHKTNIAQFYYSDKCVYDPYDQHHRVTFPNFGLGELVDKDESDWPETSYGGVHYLFPNTIIFFGAVTADSYFTQVFRLFPDGVGKTRCHFAVYAPFGIDNKSHKDMCAENYDSTAAVVQDEDYWVASKGYANLLTAPKDYHVVLGANEMALHDVHRNIAKTIGMPLDRKTL